MKHSFQSLQEFYPYYLTQHSDQRCRASHFIGTSLVIGLALAAVITQRWWLLALLPVAGYGFAWFGHFVFEKNKPAAFNDPFWSLASDFIMYWHTFTFQLPKKLEEAKRLSS